MIKYENDCCGCAAPAYPCMGDVCLLRHNPHYYCDRCGSEAELYEFNREQLCIDCVKDSLIRVK